MVFGYYSVASSFELSHFDFFGVRSKRKRSLFLTQKVDRNYINQSEYVRFWILCFCQITDDCPKNLWVVLSAYVGILDINTLNSTRNITLFQFRFSVSELCMICMTSSFSMYDLYMYDLYFLVST